MTSLLERAVVAVEALFGPTAGARIQRVDLRDGKLLLTVQRLGAPDEWFEFDGRSLRELRPSEDARVPLACTLVSTKAGAVLAYRPARRVVVGETDGGRLVRVRKGYRRRRSDAALERHEVAGLAGRRAGWQTPDVLAHDSAAEALELSPVAGSPLQFGPDAGTLVSEIGRGLHRFAATKPEITLATHEVEDELGVLDRWRSIREEVAGRLPSSARDQLERLRTASHSVPRAPLGLCHRDLHDRQFLVSGTALGLVDFDLLCLADPALDVGNFSAHLHLRALQGVRGASERSSKRLDAIFVGAAIDAAGSALDRRLPFWRSCALLRLAFVYGTRPAWRRLEPALIEESRRCFEDAHVA